MFRISRRLDYGLNLLIALSAAPESTPRPTAYLAKKLDIPLPFLHQIGHSLMQAGLVKASPGPHGGLKMNQSPETITVLKVIETLEGPVCVNPSDSNSPREKSDPCPSSFIWDDLQSLITNQLTSVTISQLVKRARTNSAFSFAFKKME
jgi:Rrf2 family protein